MMDAEARSYHEAKKSVGIHDYQPTPRTCQTISFLLMGMGLVLIVIFSIAASGSSGLFPVFMGFTMLFAIVLTAGAVLLYFGVTQNNRQFVTIWIIGMTALSGANFVMSIQALDMAHLWPTINWPQVIGVLQLLCCLISVGCLYVIYQFRTKTMNSGVVFDPVAVQPKNAVPAVKPESLLSPATPRAVPSGTRVGSVSSQKES